MTTIKVDPKFLENLASRLERVAGDLRQYSCHGSNRLSSAPKVADAYAELGGKWDERREKLAKNLDGLADAFISAKSQFVQTDDELADSLDTGSPASAPSTGGTTGSGVATSVSESEARSGSQVRSMNEIRKEIEAQEDTYLKHWLEEPAIPEWDKEWREDENYPRYQRPFNPNSPDRNAFYPGQCTAWVAFKLNLDQLPYGTDSADLEGGDLGSLLSDTNRFYNSYGGQRWGDARNWPPKDIDGVTVYDSDSDEMPESWPRPGQVAQWTRGTWGHVAYVESVTEDKIIISEMNWGRAHEEAWITTGTGVATTREISRDNREWPSRFISLELPELNLE